LLLLLRLLLLIILLLLLLLRLGHCHRALDEICAFPPEQPFSVSSNPILCFGWVLAAPPTGGGLQPGSLTCKGDGVSEMVGDDLFESSKHKAFYATTSI
jgi:hypothetical protein